MIVVVGDNAWGISVSKEASTAIQRNSDRAAAYGIPGHYTPGNDPMKIYEVAGEAIARARHGEGPPLIEVETYRLAGHFMGDAEGYRPDGEKDGLFEKDPIPAMRAKLLADGNFTEAELDALEAKAQTAVDEAMSFARESADPEPEDALTAVFA
ncbi:Acetoin:2,6-dichlorophenolindophenol oxidoreductase subunit alpha [Phaeobacter piscinae]|nr:Acetoin:2,6-dichlorophenolindophenol oxidoreductase subunit alpha [Phaeobacter piscinae]